ncbi:hypothetical protein, partial [Pseudomonas viridiflava]|uniref:hypothetical protein n=1 Tax=Pseudomonas viridiflava TaxID=33069 RepID=UPI0019816F74
MLQRQSLFSGSLLILAEGRGSGPGDASLVRERSDAVGICGSELVREGFISDDTSSADVPAPSRTSSLPQVRIPTNQPTNQPTNHSVSDHLPFTTI